MITLDDFIPDQADSHSGEKALLSANGEAMSLPYDIPRPEQLTDVRIATHTNWYAVYTRPSHEKRVGEHFEVRGIEFYLPLYRTVHHWKNRCKAELQLPLFPGYVFARLAWEQHLRVLEIPSVVSIVGNGREPLPLDNSEIESLRAGLHLRSAEPCDYLIIGERARIVTGPLAGLEGVVLRKNNGLRVVLTFPHIMKSVAVEVDASDLESLAPATSYVC